MTYLHNDPFAAAAFRADLDWEQFTNYGEDDEKMFREMERSGSFAQRPNLNW